MKTLTRCPHCQTVNHTAENLLGKPVSCEKCRRIFVAGKLEGDERKAAERDQNKDFPFSEDADTFSIRDLKLDMVRIPPGKFTMGNAMGSVNEKPEHAVQLTYPIYISSTLVTQRHYQRIMEDRPSYFEGEDLPVENVSWFQALEFCHRLSEREKVARRMPKRAFFRLPTEAEWEFVCRSGEETPDGRQGDTVVLEEKETVSALEKVAWYRDNSQGTTHPVGTKSPNSLGMYDMLGNVGEWCLDDYDIYPKTETTNPLVRAAGRQKVRRGGGWASVASRCRCTDRIGVAPACRCALIGFRIVLAQDGECPYLQNFLLL